MQDPNNEIERVADQLQQLLNARGADRQQALIAAGASQDARQMPPGSVGTSALAATSAVRDGAHFAVLPRVPLLGELMVSRGLISVEQLERALALQRQSRGRLGETLVEMGAVTRNELMQVLAEQLGVTFEDVRTRTPDVIAATLVPESMARQHTILPLEQRDNTLIVAIADPRNVFAIDDLRLLTSRHIIPVLADPEDLRVAIDRAYQQSQLDTDVEDVANEQTETASADTSESDEDAPVVRIVNGLLQQAVTERASDVHIEPLSDSIRVRFRVDGRLRIEADAPTTTLRPLVSRLKVLGGMDIAQSRIPQDGRFSLAVEDHIVDIRVETLPTTRGEAVVLRLLDSSRGAVSFDSLGLTDEDRDRLTHAFRAPQGAVFVTGPTGSGKSSTLYSVLGEINTDDTGVISIEDPVEYKLDGIKQMQVNRRAGMTFASALRAMLRADPDVIFIGEVRDGETARIAAEASITGHLVLSTLHATRAAAAPARLIDMGVEPYLVASALSCVVAQRLARRLCSNCAAPVERPDGRVLAHLGLPANEATESRIREPVGCAACRGTGYRGRFPLFEVMPLTETISRLIVDRATTADIERAAVTEGMRTLHRAALHHLQEGTLSVDEMFRVIP